MAEEPVSCAFCEIAAGGAAHVVYREGSLMGFLDRRPLFAGHTLLIPLTHHETIADLPDELFGPLMAAAKTLARAVEEGLGAEGAFLAINNRVSQSVPHVHMHVVPRRRGDGLRGFFWPRTNYESEEEMARVATRLREWIEANATPARGSRVTDL